MSADAMDPKSILMGAYAFTRIDKPRFCDGLPWDGLLKTDYVQTVGGPGLGRGRVIYVVRLPFVDAHVLLHVHFPVGTTCYGPHLRRPN